MIHSIVDQREFRLLGLAKVFAALVFKDEEDRDWLERRFAMLEDILEESWVIQETKKKGKIEGAHQNIKDFVQERFPDMLDLVEKQTNGINDLEVLNKLLKVIALAPDRKDILNALENLESGR